MSENLPGTGVTSDPVAIMIFFVRTTSDTFPSGPRTETSLTPVILPWPGIRTSTLLVKQIHFAKKKLGVERK